MESHYADLLKEVEAQRNLMIAVSTGGQEIDDVNQEYINRRQRIRSQLSSYGFEDPNPYSDLWSWHGKWSSGDLFTYASRRQYISELYSPLIDRLSD